MLILIAKLLTENSILPYETLEKSANLCSCKVFIDELKQRHFASNETCNYDVLS